RDVAFVAISRAPLSKLEAFRKRMGWSFKWVSSGRNDFNYDYCVSFRPEDLAKGEVTYNYRPFKTSMSDLVGISVFIKDEKGASIGRTGGSQGLRIRHARGSQAAPLGFVSRQRPAVRRPQHGRVMSLLHLMG